MVKGKKSRKAGRSEGGKNAPGTIAGADSGGAAQTSPPRHRPERAVSPGEADLWRRVVADVAPMVSSDTLYVAALDGLDASSDSAPSPATPPRPSCGTASRPTLSAVRVPSAVAPSSLPRLEHGVQPGLDRATAQKMRRGKIHPQRRLDLHGFTQGAAQRALASFLRAAQHDGCRDVLVITGKGLKRDGAIGVLRARVPDWLNAPENRARVVAFSHAAPKDGGEGALYIRLKKKPSPR